jgi:hypothetical protein
VADGIRFLIELDGKTQGASAATHALQDVGKAAHATNEHLRETGHADMHGLVGEIFTAEFALEGLKFGAEKALEGIKTLGEVVLETVEKASERQRTESVFANLFHPGDGKEMLEFLDQWGQRTEFSEEQTLKFGAALTKAGFEGDDFRNAMAAIGDTASLTLDKMDGAGGMMAALERMKMSGTIDKRSILHMGLNYDEVLENIGKLSGKTSKAVEEGLGKGTIPFKEEFEGVLRSVEAATHRHLGASAANMGHGMEAQLEHLKELPTKMMEGMAHSPGMDELSRAFEGILDAFSPDKGGAEIMAGMSDIFSEVAHAVKEIDWKMVRTDALDALAGIKEFIEPTKELFKEVGSLIHSLINDIERLARGGRAMGDWMAELLHPELKQTHAAGAIQVGHRIQQAGIELPTGYQGHTVNLSDKPVNMSPVTRLEDMSAEYQAGQKKNAAEHQIIAPPTLSQIPSLKLIEGGRKGNVHIDGARADVQVNVNGAKATPDDIHHAVKRGVEEGLTSAQEKQAAMAGAGG